MSSPPTTGDTLHNGTSWAWATAIIVVVILQSAMGADYMIMAQVGFFCAEQGHNLKWKAKVEFTKVFLIGRAMQRYSLVVGAKFL